MLVPEFMAAVHLVGHGNFDQLVYFEHAPVPQPGAGEVLLRVLAAGVNNTDINTRVGWYADEVKSSTANLVTSDIITSSGDWSGQGLRFPLIQGADVCGLVVAVGAGISNDRIGQRVIVQSCLVSLKQGSFTPWLGSERDGGFAQFVVAPSADTYAVNSGLTDAELAAVPCAFGTAENLISRAQLRAGERVLITGSSGNVGIAAIQLAKRRGAHVTAIAAPDKIPNLMSVGADAGLERGAALTNAANIDVVIDVVGGPQWPELLDVLNPRGRYAVSGAIAGPIVELDLRKLYLKDLTLYGCTTQDAHIFSDLIGYLERGEIRPIVSQEFALRDIVAAQKAFLLKQQVGKIVLIPPL